MLLSLRILLGLSALITIGLSLALLLKKGQTLEEERRLRNSAIICACVTLAFSVTVLLLR